LETSLSTQSIALVLTTKNKETKHQIYTKYTTETEKTAVADRTIYILIWYAFYDLWSGKGVSPILTASEPTWGYLFMYVSPKLSWLIAQFAATT